MTAQPAFQPCEWASCRDIATTRSSGYAFCQTHALEDHILSAQPKTGPKACIVCGGPIVRPATIRNGAWAKRCETCKGHRQHPPADTQEAAR